MEDVLEVYQRPIDAKVPLVCMDEFSKQLLSDPTPPLPMRPNSSAKKDYEYVREGSVSSFVFALPHEGLRHLYTSETGKRTAQDWAKSIKYLVDEIHPEADKIVLVMDNLNTHKTASLYATFPAEEARRIADKLEIHYTPKHGSWLNMAEIEIGKLTGSGLKERISSQEEMEKQMQAYLEKANHAPKPIEWQFANQEARVKLKSLYPTI